MSSLSSLLNPEPTENILPPPTEARKSPTASSQGQHQLPAPYPGMQDVSTDGDASTRALAKVAVTPVDPTSLDILDNLKQESAPDADLMPLVGHDTSVLVQEEMKTGQHHDKGLKAELQHLADHREPAYCRDEPVISQIRSLEHADPSPKTHPSLPSPDHLDSDPSPPSPDRSISQSATNTAHSPVKALKHEHSTHTHSPLRDSSIPVQSTEIPTPTSTVPRKRPAPKSAGKKGTASNVRGGPASKKRKTAPAPKRLATPSQKPKAGLAGAKKLTSTSATPSVRNASTPPRSVTSIDPEADDDSEGAEEDEEEGTPDPDANLYCLCRKPDTGTFMIGCDGGCEDWFHGKCVGVVEKDKNLIDRYICPRCVEKGLGPTTWKRMCRRIGCRLPARTPGSDAARKAKKTSKYCTDACGLQYFKDLVIAKTRGMDGRPKGKRKPTEGGSPDDLGPRGGSLSIGELKALVNTSNGVDQFKRLGEGILSPPTTPSPEEETQPTDDNNPPSDSLFNPAEQTRISGISDEKDAARTKHNLLKDRMKFITMLKQAAANTANERHLKPKDFCGFDARLLWTDAEFAAWRAGAEASAALKTGVLPASMMVEVPVVDADGDTGMSNGNGDDSGNTAVKVESVGGGGGGGGAGVCARKKCLRHHDWSKLALDEVRFEVGENSEVMRALEREEKDVRQRAGLRARVLRAGGKGGEVVRHEEFDGVGEMDMDVDVEGEGMEMGEGEESRTPVADEAGKRGSLTTAEEMIAEIASLAGTAGTV